jgi:hypothetical protein
MKGGATVEQITANAGTKIYTIRGAAKASGKPEFALRNWCKRGDIRHVKAGNRVYLTLDAIEEFVKSGGAKQ